MTFGDLPSDNEDVDPNQNNQAHRELIENLYNEYVARNPNNQDHRELIENLWAECEDRNQKNPDVISKDDLASHLHDIFRNRIFGAFKDNLNNSPVNYKQYTVDGLEDFALFETDSSATEKVNDHPYRKGKKVLLMSESLPLSSSNNNNSLYYLISNSINNIYPALSNLFFKNNNLIALVFALLTITPHCKTPKDSNGSGSHGGSGAGGSGGIFI